MEVGKRYRLGLDLLFLTIVLLKKVIEKTLIMKTGLKSVSRLSSLYCEWHKKLKKDFSSKDLVKKLLISLINEVLTNISLFHFHLTHYHKQKYQPAFMLELHS